MTGTSTDATKKLLGYEYQKLIALDVCLNAKPNQAIYIECYGDVAINDTSMEIKHHFNRSNLNDAHIDFWKTLYNLVNERHNLASFAFFELHTTSNVNEDSIFYNWNKLTKTKKYQKIKSVKSNETIKSKYDGVFSIDKNILQNILSKFSIYPSQVKIEDKVNELLNHDTFKLSPKNNRHHFIDKMLGYITKQAINNSDRWEVVSNDFNKDMLFFFEEVY